MTEFRKGDIVDVRGVVLRAPDKDEDIKVQFRQGPYDNDPDSQIYVRADTATLVERPVPPAKVGDRIVPVKGRRPAAKGEATILGVDGDEWWVKWDGGVHNTYNGPKFIADGWYERVPV